MGGQVDGHISQKLVRRGRGGVVRRTAWIYLIVPLVIGIHLAIVLFLTKHGVHELLSEKFTIAQLGAYGDSFAPFTGIFAVVAAIFAGRAYMAQRESLELEQNRDISRGKEDAKARFDQLFFRAIEVYDDAYARLGRAARSRGRDTTAYGLVKDVRQKYEGGDAGFSADSAKFFEELFEKDKYRPVGRFVRAVYAIVLWIDGAAKIEDLARWIRLFEERLSWNERKLLTELVACHAKQDVRDAANRLRLFVSSN